MLMEPINSVLIIILGVYTLVWGLWVINPFWNVFTQASLYSQMATYPEWAWGAFATISGIGIIYGVYKGSNKSLRSGAGIAYFHWLIISIMYFMGDWKNTGGITALAFAVYALVVFLALRKNPGISIKRYKK
jgi:hypothetical protein